MSERTKKNAAAAVRNAAGDPHPITLLPFVKDNKNAKGGRNFWAIDGRTGDYGLDCLLGTAMAQQAIRYMKQASMPVLASIVKDMINAGTFSGVEVGFLQELCRAAIKS